MKSLAFLSIASIASGYPQRDLKTATPPVGACSGDCGYVHDPAVAISNGVYYRFVTFNKITIATAPSISGPWTNQGSALPNGSSINKPGHDVLWAPDVIKIGNTWYLTYAVSTPGSQNSDIGIATSPSLDVGSWTDHGSIGVPDNSIYNKIDPNIFIRPDNNELLLSFGSYWGDIFQVPLQTPPLKIASAVPHNIERNTTAPLASLPTGPEEGSYQFWWPAADGTKYYYLFWSSGNCCPSPSNLPPPGEEYKVMVCRSTSPTAGFVDKNDNDCTNGGGSIVLQSHDNVYAPGGQGVIFDPGQNSVVMYYHYINPTIGYSTEDFQFGWNTLDFSSGWPVVVEGKPIPTLEWISLGSSQFKH